MFLLAVFSQISVRIFQLFLLTTVFRHLKCLSEENGGGMSMFFCWECWIYEHLFVLIVILLHFPILLLYSHITVFPSSLRQEPWSSQLLTCPCMCHPCPLPAWGLLPTSSARALAVHLLPEPSTWLLLCLPSQIILHPFPAVSPRFNLEDWFDSSPWLRPPNYPSLPLNKVPALMLTALGLHPPFPKVSLHHHGLLVFLVTFLPALFPWHTFVLFSATFFCLIFCLICSFKVMLILQGAAQIPAVKRCKPGPCCWPTSGQSVT